jgi:hypothetical protein
VEAVGERAVVLAAVGQRGRILASVGRRRRSGEEGVR